MKSKGMTWRSRLTLLPTLALSGVLLVAVPAAASDVPPNDGPNDVTASVTTVPASATVTQQFYNDLSNEAGDVCASSSAENANKLDGGTGTVTWTDGEGNVATFSITGDKVSGYTATMTGGTMTDIVLKSNESNNNWYRFTPGVTYASPLFTGTDHGLSHTIVCWNPLEPSTTLSLDTSGLTVAGVSSYDATTNTLTVYAGSSVTLDATETNDGDVELTNAHVVFSGESCAGGNQKPDPGVTLAAGADLDVSCTFTAAEGSSTITLIGHGTYDGKDVTWCADPSAPPAGVICDQDERDTINIEGINPSTDLDLDVLNSSASSQTGTNPERHTINVEYGGDVDLQFLETNDGDEELTNVHIAFVNGAPECVDTAGGVTLQPGDTHTVTCSTITNITAHRTITAIGHGTDLLGNDVTWCQDPANPPAGTVCDQDEIVIVDIVVNFGEGCTPGLWGQYDNVLGKGNNARYHWIRDEWAASPYGFDSPASGVFDSNGAWDSYTLGELTNRGGGGEAALGRAASAALQNILHPDISYGGGFTVQSLIDAVEAAFDSGDAAIEALKNTLDDLNNEGDCGLSNE